MDRTVTVNVRELRERLADYLRQAEQGAELVIISRNRPVARLMPPPRPEPRQIGVLEGQIWMADDFDETPGEVAASMDQSLDP